MYGNLYVHICSKCSLLTFRLSAMLHLLPKALFFLLLLHWGAECVTTQNHCFSPKPLFISWTNNLLTLPYVFGEANYFIDVSSIHLCHIGKVRTVGDTEYDHIIVKETDVVRTNQLFYAVKDLQYINIKMKSWNKWTVK